MLAMVPGLLAARAGHALMLPMFSAIVRRGEPLTRSFALMCEATAILAALYLSVFITRGRNAVAARLRQRVSRAWGPWWQWLAAMWSHAHDAGRSRHGVDGGRPYQAVPCRGHHPRQCAADRALCGPAWRHAQHAIAAIGCAGEAASLLYIAWRLDRLERRLGFILITRSLFLVPRRRRLASWCDALQPSGLLEAAALVSMVLLAILASGIGLMPGLLAQARRSIMPSRIIAAE